MIFPTLILFDGSSFIVLSKISRKSIRASLLEFGFKISELKFEVKFSNFSIIFKVFFMAKSSLGLIVPFDSLLESLDISDKLSSKVSNSSIFSGFLVNSSTPSSLFSISNLLYKGSLIHCARSLLPIKVLHSSNAQNIEPNFFPSSEFLFNSRFSLVFWFIIRKFEILYFFIISSFGVKFFCVSFT